MTDQRRRPLKIGAFIGIFDGFADGRTTSWADVAAMARHAEAIGFDSVWLPDHFLVPATPLPEPGGVWECGSMLAAMAAITSRVEIGTLVLCTGFRNPALVAKMADTVDEISGGRLILGLGAGYHEPEYHAFGYPTDHKSSRFAEALQIISGLLKHGSIDFDGAYYQAHVDAISPRGPRPNGPPIMVGSRGPKALRLMARYADSWNAPLWGKNNRPEDLEPGMSMVNEACAEVGRDPATLERTAGIQWSASDDLDHLPDWMRIRFGPPLIGAMDEVVEVFRAFAQAGVSHVQVVIWPHTLAGFDAFRPILEALDRDG
jgi:probable F420-dependent oxidoreductase